MRIGGDGVPFARTRMRAYHSFTRTIRPTNDDDHDDDDGDDEMSSARSGAATSAVCVRDDDEDTTQSRAVHAEIDTLRREIRQVQSAIDAIKARRKHAKNLDKAPPDVAEPFRATRVNSRRSLAPRSAFMCEPTTRDMAIVLSQRLDEILPEGAIERKYAMCEDVRSVDAFGDEFAVVDGALREGARQVAAACRDRGRVLDVIRERYGELFATMRDACDRWRRRNDASDAQLEEISRALAEKERERAAFTETVNRCRRELATATRAHRNERARADAIVSRARLEVDALATSRTIDRAEIRRLRQRAELADARLEREIAHAVTSMEDSLSRAVEDRDRLEQRVLYLDARLVETRAALPDRSTYETIETQTTALDAVGIKALLADANAGVSVEISTQTDAATVVGKRRHKGDGAAAMVSDKTSLSSGGADRWLGGFAALVSSQKATGRHKPRAWVLKCIAHVYGDKITLDATETSTHGSDEGASTTSASEPPLAAFAYDWHLHKFGLRQLAENNLLDLVASATVHAHDCALIAQFGAFCGFITGEEHALVDAPTVAFYLRLVDALANANPLSQLFLDYGLVDDSKQLDSGSDAGSISLSRINDALKRVFDDFKEDGAALKDFVVKTLGVSRASSSTTVKFTPFIRAVMDEYTSRRHANMLTLKSLFRAANVSDSAALVYDEFHAALRVADAKLAEASIAKAFQTFSTKRDKRSPPSMHVDDFIKACLASGLDKFRVAPERIARNSSGDRAATSVGDDSGESGASPPNTSNSTMTKSPSSSAAWLALLDDHMSSSDGAMVRLESLRQTQTRATASILARCERQAARLLALKSNPSDGEAAYLAYKILTADVRAAYVKSKGGFKRLGDVVLTRVTFSMRANASRRRDADAVEADTNAPPNPPHVADIDPFV
jgi:hypothetical protein